MTQVRSLVLLLAATAVLGFGAAAVADVTAVDPSRGTVGTEITIRGSGFSPTGKKAKARLQRGGGKARGTRLAVTSTADSAVGAFVKKGKPGLYDVQVQPKGGAATTLADAFEICLVEHVVASPQGAAPGDTVTLTADCMPTKPGTIRIGGKKAKRLGWDAAAGSITIEVPRLDNGTYDVEIKTAVGTTTVPGGLQVGGQVPVEDQIIQAVIGGQPFEATLPGIVVTKNTLGPIATFSIQAGSNVAGDPRTILIQFAFDPATMTSGTFRTALELQQFVYVPAPGVSYGLGVDPTTLLTSGVVEVTGNVAGKITGTFSADLVPPPGQDGPGVRIASGVFAVRETPVGGASRGAR